MKYLCEVTWKLIENCCLQAVQKSNWLFIQKRKKISGRQLEDFGFGTKYSAWYQTGLYLEAGPTQPHGDFKYDLVCRSYQVFRFGSKHGYILKLATNDPCGKGYFYPCLMKDWISPSLQISLSFDLIPNIIFRN